MSPAPHIDPSHDELAALADGTLPAARRQALEAEAAASPRLAAALAEQRRALAITRAAVAETEAPASLRAALDAQGRARSRKAWRVPRRMLAVATAGVAAVVVALATILPSGGPGAPSVAQAAELGAQPPQLAASGVDPAHPTLLSRSAAGVPYPNLRAKFGWTDIGARSDRLKGRDATTVYYRKAGRQIAYTIVSGKPLFVPGGGGAAVVEGTTITSLRVGGRRVATWTRGGRTCVLSGTGVDQAVLNKLAGWKGKGTVPF